MRSSIRRTQFVFQQAENRLHAQKAIMLEFMQYREVPAVREELVGASER